MKSETRDEFQRMIRMCELKQIDLIITKSISRFARNTKDALAYVRKLKLLGVGVQFEKEGISTLSMGDEMLLNTFSALAQEESQSISIEGSSLFLFLYFIVDVLLNRIEKGDLLLW